MDLSLLADEVWNAWQEAEARHSDAATSAGAIRWAAAGKALANALHWVKEAEALTQD